MNYEEYILNELIDRYERSSAYRGNNKLNRGIYLEYNKQTMPEYFKDYTSKFKEAVNTASINLENRDFIKIQWLKHEKGNIIQKVSLNTDKASQIYSFLKRQPRKSKERDIIKLAVRYMESVGDWAEEFYKHLISSVEKGKDMALYIDINDPGLTENIFKSVNAISVLDEEVPARIFSTRVLGKSKEFERIKGRVSRIVRDFMKFEVLDREDDILSVCGIVNNPSHVFFSGPLKVLAGPRCIDYSCFEGGIGISPQTVNSMEICEIGFKKIITIENLTSYYEFIKKSGSDCLAVYTGGYPGMVQIKFLKKIADSAAKGKLNIVFYHWGDIDFGGFSIFTRLKKLVQWDIKPLMMDTASLEKYKDYCIPLEHKYRNRLKELLTEDDYRDFHEVIKYMVENNMKLEQECIEVNDVLDRLNSGSKNTAN